MINVAKVVIRKDGQYLLIKRSTSLGSFREQWEFPGGKTDGIENLLESAIREIKEETNLSVKLEERGLERDCFESEKAIHYIIFLTSEYQGDIRLSEEHSKFAWLSKEQIESYDTTPLVKEYFRRMRR